VDDVEILADLNIRFIEAFRQGSWEHLAPVLAPSFTYLDGTTGEAWTLERYVAELRGNPLPTIEIDQVVIHVDGDVAIVSARSSTSAQHHNRYIDTYTRGDDGWRCIHACVWKLHEASV
jgi:Domain of unknown function (DUF4440)